MRKQDFTFKGFTLIELLIVIAIIGIVAAIAIPNLLTALQKGRQKATMGDLKTIGQAVEAYMSDNTYAPQTGNTAIDQAGIRNILEPFYIRIIPLRDGWNNIFQYHAGNDVNSRHRGLYSIISYGRDMINSGQPAADNNYPVTDLDHFNNDICYSNGQYTYGPKIK